MGEYSVISVRSSEGRTRSSEALTCDIRRESGKFLLMTYISSFAYLRVDGEMRWPERLRNSLRLIIMRAGSAETQLKTWHRRNVQSVERQELSSSE